MYDVSQMMSKSYTYTKLIERIHAHERIQAVKKINADSFRSDMPSAFIGTSIRELNILSRS